MCVCVCVGVVEELAIPYTHMFELCWASLCARMNVRMYVYIILVYTKVGTYTNFVYINE
jgi:hypothetical protein